MWARPRSQVKKKINLKNTVFKILKKNKIEVFNLLFILIILFFSIGSLGRSFDEDGVENVTLTNSVFSGSDNGLRIKTWARPSKGFVRNINYKNILMKNVEHPIIIDQNYCPNNQGCPSQVNIKF